MSDGPVSHRLPDFPWDTLAPFAVQAAAYPDGLVDLSIGTPVDHTPAVVQDALSAAADAPGYPQTYGTPALRGAVAAWFARRRPTIGSKELVAWLPTLLGLGPGDVVVHPEIAYPTYDVGARLAGATPVAADGLTALGPARVRLVWLNSPSNPTGRVLPPEHLRKMVDRFRCCPPTSATARTTGCSRSTRCPSSRTWPAIGQRSSRVMFVSSASCSRCASTPA